MPKFLQLVVPNVGAEKNEVPKSGADRGKTPISGVRRCHLRPAGVWLDRGGPDARVGMLSGFSYSLCDGLS